jgi:hypothetical protein
MEPSRNQQGSQYCRFGIGSNRYKVSKDCQLELLEFGKNIRTSLGKQHQVQPREGSAIERNLWRCLIVGHERCQPACKETIQCMGGTYKDDCSTAHCIFGIQSKDP